MRIQSLLILLLLVPSLSWGAPRAAQEILQNVYNGHQFVGIALGNHSSMTPLNQANEFLTSYAGADLNFKFVFIEAPNDTAETLKQASLGDFPWYETESKLAAYWWPRVTMTPQWHFMFTRTVMAVQNLNKHRPGNPVIIVPIDGYDQVDNARDEELFQSQKHPYIFGGSNTREIQTAEMFLNSMKESPEAKALIIYHQAHILKSLTSGGYEVDQNGELIETVTDHLGWVGYVNDVLPNFYNSLGVVLFNEADPSMNPLKTINSKFFTEEPYQPGFGNLTSDFLEIQSLQSYLAPESFLGRYRGQTVVFPKDPKKSFEAFIEY